MSTRLDEDSELMIDGVRGIAALLVMLAHCVDYSIASVFGWDLSQSPEHWRWTRASIGYGGFWVWCFFVISGLCIQQSIARSITEGSFTWKRYFLARVTRIYPMFLLGLALAILAWSLLEDWGDHRDPTPWRQLLASLVSLQILTTSFPGLETSWSLSCEMIYYVAWPTGLLLCRGNASASVKLCLTLALSCTAFILLLWKYFHRMEHSAFVDGVWTLSVLFPVWLCGAWLAGNWQMMQRRVGGYLWAISIVLCLVSEVLLAILKFKQYPGWAMHLAGWSSIPGLMLFLAGAKHLGLSGRSWAKPVCRWLGQISYPCYILHMPLILIMGHYLGRWVESPLWRMFWITLPLVTLMALCGPPLERHFMRWRQRILGRPVRKALTVNPVTAQSEG